MVMLKNGSTTRRRERGRMIKNLIDYEGDYEDEDDFHTRRARYTKRASFTFRHRSRILTRNDTTRDSITCHRVAGRF
jgi:hypothetical protein